MARRRAAMEKKGALAWKPATRKRHISQALEAYALFTTSASKGAVRDVRGATRGRTGSKIVAAE